MTKVGVSERVACRVLGQHRSTQRKAPKGRADDAALTADIVALATQYGRYGYRRITALLRAAGWAVNSKWVERIWRLEGLKVPQKQPKKGRLWLNDGSCVRLRPERPNHVWSYDFVEDRTHNGRKFRMLNVIDEFTRECLAIRIDRKLKSTDVIDVLSDLFILRGVPGHVRSDNVLCWELSGLRHQVTGRPSDRTLWQGSPRWAPPSRNGLSHSEHRVRAAAALTVLKTRSEIPSGKPEHYLRGRFTPPRLDREGSFRLGSPPRRRGDRVRRA